MNDNWTTLPPESLEGDSDWPGDEEFRNLDENSFSLDEKNEDSTVSSSDDDSATDSESGTENLDDVDSIAEDIDDEDFIEDALDSDSELDQPVPVSQETLTVFFESWSLNRLTQVIASGISAAIIFGLFDKLTPDPTQIRLESKIVELEDSVDQTTQLLEMFREFLKGNSSVF